ncbi:MAG: hypothetical protein ACK5L6_12250 [Anaerorhabdus sp.]
MLKRIIDFVDFCDIEKAREECIYKVFKLGKDACFEKMKREMIK